MREQSRMTRVTRQRGLPRQTARRSNARGVTLIELAVAMLVGLLVVGVVWALFSGGARHFRNTDERLQAVQAAQTLIEQLRSDLEQAFVDPEHPIEAGDGVLEFLAADPAAPAGHRRPAPGGRRVRYELDAATNRVLRNGDPLAFAGYESLSFGFVAGNPTDPHAPRDPRTGESSPNLVTFRITTAAPAILQRDPEGTDRAARTTLAGAVRIAQETYAAQFREWVDHGFEVPLGG